MAESPGKCLIRMDEVKKHMTRQSLWMVMDDKVYDITDYISEHPGGEAVLIEEAGTDATEVFEDVGHSSDARIDRDTFYIGDLHPDDILTKEQMAKLNDSKSKGNAPQVQSIYQNKLFISGAVALGIATVYGLYKYHQQS